MSEQAIPAQREPFAARLRRGALWVSFAFILLIPKLLGLRKDSRAWFAFRAALGLFGAALVVVPLGLWSAAVIGLAIFLTAALLGPAKSETSLDAKKRELGALVIVNGGRYAQAGGEAARLFVGAERIWALDRRLHPLVVFPAAEIRAVRAVEAPPGWALRIEWQEHIAEFLYDGVFAEHLARVAESTVRCVLRPALPVIQRSQAAGG